MNTNFTLVSELRNWIVRNRERLGVDFVSISDKLPAKEENEQTKGCIGLIRGHILISFTTWDRQPISAELLIYNTHLDKTIVMEDYDIFSVGDVIEDLTKISGFLVKGHYDDMNPDPKISS